MLHPSPNQIRENPKLLDVGMGWVGYVLDNHLYLEKEDNYIKAEKRGKYPGIKLHLDPDECQAFLKLHQDASLAQHPPSTIEGIGIAVKIGSKLAKLMKENPTLLVDRTQDEILSSLKKDQEKITKQLDAIQGGSDWKMVD